MATCGRKSEARKGNDSVTATCPPSFSKAVLNPFSDSNPYTASILNTAARATAPAVRMCLAIIRDEVAIGGQQRNIQPLPFTDRSVTTMEAIVGISRLATCILVIWHVLSPISSMPATFCDSSRLKALSDSRGSNFPSRGSIFTLNGRLPDALRSASAI